MSVEEDLKDLSSLFKALSNQARLRILQIITRTKRPLHIKAISQQLQIDYAAVYRHIKVLEDSGLLKIYEVGRSRVVTINDPDAIEKLLEDAKSITSTNIL